MEIKKCFIYTIKIDKEYDLWEAVVEINEQLANEKMLDRCKKLDKFKGIELKMTVTLWEKFFIPS